MITPRKDITQCAQSRSTPLISRAIQNSDVHSLSLFQSRDIHISKPLISFLCRLAVLPVGVMRRAQCSPVTGL